MGRRRKKPVTLRAARTEQTFDGPQKTGSGQLLVLENFEEGSAGQSRRYRNIAAHPLEMARERQMISPELYTVGNTYRIMFEKMGRSGRDSTQALDRIVNGASPTPFSQIQVDAVRAIEKLERSMPARDARIVRKFCGEGVPMNEAVQRATPCHPNGIKFRLVEALEQLHDAFERERLHIVA